MKTETIIVILTVILVALLLVAVFFLCRRKRHKEKNVDLMEGHDFEYYCAELLKKCGFGCFIVGSLILSNLFLL